MTIDSAQLEQRGFPPWLKLSGLSSEFDLGIRGLLQSHAGLEYSAREDASHNTGERSSFAQYGLRSVEYVLGFFPESGPIS